uniref:Uncharacterized protein n=1 Tax=Arion vulgaris TaxID=1028688 RepID=A0A0B6YCR0_9EUPU
MIIKSKYVTEKRLINLEKKPTTLKHKPAKPVVKITLSLSMLPRPAGQRHIVKTEIYR